MTLRTGKILPARTSRGVVVISTDISADSALDAKRVRHASSPHVVAFMGKGGSAKTTSAAALAEAFARRDLRVLLVDLDVQTSLSDWLAPPNRRLGVAECLLQNISLADAKVTLRRNLDLLPGLPAATHNLERNIEARPRRREDLLVDWVRANAYGYDYVVLDTPRGLAGGLNINALEAADSVIIPTELSGMGLDAARELINFVALTAEARERPDLLTGILPTRVTRTRLAASSLAAFEDYGRPVLTPIPAATAAGEAVTLRLLLADYAPDSPATVAYNDVATHMTGLEAPLEVPKGKEKKKKGKKGKNKKGKNS